MRWATAVRCGFLVLLIIGVAGDNCRIRWIDMGHEVEQSKFHLEMTIKDIEEGNEDTYFPDTKYDIRITSANETFTKFYFTISNENATKNYGFLELREKDLSRFHNGPYCFNRIVDGPNSLDKRKLTIGWHSPPVNSGCISFKVFVRETDERYHIANKTVCQDPRVELDDPGTLNRNCCACDEGKYELAFEGLWSRYYHPKHFPKQEWLATFPTVIGVSHDMQYSLYSPYTNASEGLKRFAEYGYVKALESEIKSNASRIRTLMKFQGSNFQNGTKKSYTMFRVNKKQHLVSLVARIDPSPDWFIGVESLELCLPDCTWIKKKTLNLYAFDVGVREGIVYEPPVGEPPDELTQPPDVIQKLNMTWPPPREDGREGPFYDRLNNTHEVRPLAQIHLRRLRGSEKKCEKDQVIDSETCATPWSAWSQCSVDCGKGIQERNRTKRPDYPDCRVNLIEKRTCPGRNAKRCEHKLSEDECRLTEWGPWRKCNELCGQEATKRTREYLWKDKAEKCAAVFGPRLMEEIADCGNPPCPEDQLLCHEDRYLSWSNYSTCQEIIDANGEKSHIKFRFRQLNKNYIQKPEEKGLNANTDGGYSGCLYEEVACTPLSVDPMVSVPKEPEPVQKPNERPQSPPIHEEDNFEVEEEEPPTPSQCLLPMNKGKCLDGHESISNRYYYNSQEKQCMPLAYSGCGGNANNFHDQEACYDTCIIKGRRIDCVMADEFTEWSECSFCDQVSTRMLEVKVRPRNGGRPCPLSTKQYRSCSTVLPRCKPDKKKPTTEDTKN